MKKHIMLLVHEMLLFEFIYEMIMLMLMLIILYMLLCSSLYAVPMVLPIYNELMLAKNLKCSSLV
jgi:hypothetical protein